MGKSQAERLWLLGGVVAGFLLLLIGYFLLISPQRSQTSNVNGQVSSARSQNNLLQSRLAVLRAQNTHLSTYRASLSQAQHALPASSGLPDFLRTLQTLGGTTSTHVVSLTVGAPISADPSTAASTTPSSGSSSSSAAPSTPSSSAVPSGIYALPITAQVTGSTSALGRFLQQLQEVQPRAILITQITEGSAQTSAGAASTTGRGAGSSAGNSLQLTMQAFVAPSAAPAPVGTTTP